MASEQEIAELAKEFEYLDELRASGRTNMFGASNYLEAERGLERRDARRVLGLWMESFDPSVSAEDRAAKVTAK